MEKIQHPDRIEKVYEFTIPKGQSSERLDNFLTRMIPNATRTKVQKAIAAERVLVNSKTKKPSYKIAPMDHILCTVMKLPPIELIPEEIPLNIVYEDDYLIVVNKPAGMCVHPGIGNRYGTLVNALLYYFGIRDSINIEVTDLDDDDNETDNDELAESDDLAEQDNESYININDIQINGVRPFLVHRIDKDTTGLLVVAKTLEVHRGLSEQFSKKTSTREYNAIVWGKPKKERGTIDGNIGRSPNDRKAFAVVEHGGKPAITDYEVLEYFLYTSLLKFNLHTGRTHQIRVHAASIGHKLFGDVRYGGDKVLFGRENPQWRNTALKYLTANPRQMLHAKTLGFLHPITKQWMDFDSELPDDMLEQIVNMRKFIK